MSSGGKPTGALLLAILQLISALIWLAVGIWILTAIGFDPAAILTNGVTLLTFLAVGIAGLIVFYGLWTLRGWAWLWALVINIIGIIGVIFAHPVYSWWYYWSLLGIPIGNLVLLFFGVIIVVYLLIPGTRAHFERPSSP
ncbi:MAG: hypothetical protein EAX95_15450 [Candidatus Thorarchaeota archaeon]|nr:hypothetical protein [Candidatus Thorarchaeota archaeon]